MNPVFSRSCYQQSFFSLSGNLFVPSTFLHKLQASSNYQLFQTTSFSELSASTKYRLQTNTGFFNFLNNFQLLQIPASENYQLLRNTGFEKLSALNEYLSFGYCVLTTDSTDIPCRKYLENLDHLGFAL